MAGMPDVPIPFKEHHVTDICRLMLLSSSACDPPLSVAEGIGKSGCSPPLCQIAEDPSRGCLRILVVA